MNVLALTLKTRFLTMASFVINIACCSTPTSELGLRKESMLIASTVVLGELFGHTIEAYRKTAYVQAWSHLVQIRVDAELHVTGWNDRAAALIGISDDALGRDLVEFFVPATHRAAARESLGQAIRGEIMMSELSFCANGGEYLTLLMSMTLHEMGDTLQGLHLVAQDITESKAVQARQDLGWIAYQHENEAELAKMKHARIQLATLLASEKALISQLQHEEKNSHQAQELDAERIAEMLTDIEARLLPQAREGTSSRTFSRVYSVLRDMANRARRSQQQAHSHIMLRQVRSTEQCYRVGR